MSSTWYVAPANVNKWNGPKAAGVTLATIGDTGYGSSWAQAASWVDFNAAGGIWQAKYGNGDTIVFLSGGQYNLADVTGGWTALNYNYTTPGTLVSLKVDGSNGGAVFVGTRTAPWPIGYSSVGTGQVVNNGETFMNITGAGGAPTVKNLRFRNIQYTFTPNAATQSVYLGTLNQNNCSAKNTAGGLAYSQTKAGGMMDVVQTNIRCMGYSKGNARMWGKVTINGKFNVLDSEFQETVNTASATSTSGAHVMDALVKDSVSTWPMNLENVIGVNHSAGGSQAGANYRQGDGFVAEENAGFVVGRKIITYSNGDRGVDLKCAGNLDFVLSLGDGTAGVSHHQDNLPLIVTRSILRNGSRAIGVTTKSAVMQTSGAINAYISALICKPTAAQAINNGIAVLSGSCDPNKWQMAIFGTYHQGVFQLFDCLEVLASLSTTATEANGFTSGMSDAGGLGCAIFGCTPGSTRNFAIRALSSDGSASALTASQQVVFDSAPSAGADTAAPATPTGLAVSNTTSSTVTLSFVTAPQDSGTEIQGHIFYERRYTSSAFSTAIDSAPVQLAIGKSASPVVLSGFKPGTFSKFYIASYDCNGNISPMSAGVNVSFAAGTANSVAPATPVQDTSSSTVSGTFLPVGWVSHPSVAGLIFKKASSGATPDYYEICDTDAGNAVVARLYPIPIAGSFPTYTKVGGSLALV